MRSPTSGIAAALTATASQPGFLVKLELAAGVTYLTDLDADFTYAGQIWTSSDLQVQGINWIAGPPQRGKLILGDADLAWWTLALQLTLQDTKVSIWQAYESAPTEGEPLWIGRIGAVKRGAATVECDLVLESSLAHSPRRRVEQVIASRYLFPAGKIIMIGGQKWVLERA